MNFFFKILILLRWIKANSELMNSWFLSNNKDLILFTLNKGVFQERLLAIETLRKFNDKNLIPALLTVAENDYHKIAMKALKTATFLDENEKHNLEIDEIKLYWQKKIEQKKNRVVSSVKKNKVSKQNRMQALEKLKQQLKRPMAGGKWF